MLMVERCHSSPVYFRKFALRSSSEESRQINLAAATTESLKPQQRIRVQRRSVKKTPSDGGWKQRLWDNLKKRELQAMTEGLTVSSNRDCNETSTKSKLRQDARLALQQGVPIGKLSRAVELLLTNKRRKIARPLPPLQLADAMRKTKRTRKGSRSDLLAGSQNRSQNEDNKSIGQQSETTQASTTTSSTAVSTVCSTDTTCYSQRGRQPTATHRQYAKAHFRVKGNESRNTTHSSPSYVPQHDYTQHYIHNNVNYYSQQFIYQQRQQQVFNAQQ